MLRAISDASSQPGLTWLHWLSPIGWAQQFRPYAGDRWWLLLLCLVAGGALMVRWGTKRSLWIFGFLQSLAGLTFLILSYTGKNTAVMTAVISVENFMIGLGVAALSGIIGGKHPRGKTP